MYQVNIKQIAEKKSRDLDSYTYLAEVFENGEKVEETKFYGAEVHTDEVRVLTGGGLRVSMLQGNAVSSNATQVTGDMIDAFAEMQSGDDGVAGVVSKESPWSSTVTFDGDE